MWIESLKTLMNDNKTLTLASNERIAAAPQIKLGNSQPLHLSLDMLIGLNRLNKKIE